MRDHARQCCPVTIAIDQVLLRGAVTVALRLVGMVQLSQHERIIRARQLRVVGNRLLQLLLQLVLLQLVTHLLLLHHLLELRVQRRRNDPRLCGGLRNGLPCASDTDWRQREHADQERPKHEML